MRGLRLQLLSGKFLFPFFPSSFLEIRFTLLRIWTYVLLPFLSFGPVF